MRPRDRQRAILNREARRETGYTTKPLDRRYASRFLPKIKRFLVHLGGFFWVPLRDRKTGKIVYNLDGSPILEIDPHPYAQMRDVASCGPAVVSNDTTARIRRGQERHARLKTLRKA